MCRRLEAMASLLKEAKLVSVSYLCILLCSGHIVTATDGIDTRFTVAG